MDDSNTATLDECTQIPFQRRYPAEIQDLIWISAINIVGPRIVRIKSLRNQHQSPAHPPPNPDDCGNGFCTPHGCIPLVLQICHRSRQLALPHWTRCLRIPSHEPFTRIFFDQESDFVYDSLPGLTSPLCILPHARNIAVELPQEFIDRRLHFQRGYRLARQIRDALFDTRTILLIIPEIERYISGTAAGKQEQQEGEEKEVLEFSADDVPGWIYSGMCSWYRVERKPRPEIRFAGKEKAGERIYDRCVLENQDSVVWDLHFNLIRS